IKAAFNLPFIIHNTILTAGLGESFLAQELAEIEDNIPPHIKLAYLPKLGQVRLRLSGKGDDEKRLKQEIAHLADQIIAKISQHVVVADDIAIEKAILNRMKASKLTLSTAESCTGGYISHLLTQHAGSSAVFAGGAVVYSYDMKESVLGVKHETLTAFGAVSEQTVKEMAKGAIFHFKTDYAIAVSGIAGPDGGMADKPVGTVWIAIASKERVVAKLFTFGSKRLQNIERSATAAFTLLLKLLKEDAG
ncbi:MAG: nicotinamide-nucleotide amidohydrolase family protein, partial [Chitinophagaceae bacterium]